MKPKIGSNEAQQVTTESPFLSFLPDAELRKNEHVDNIVLFSMYEELNHLKDIFGQISLAQPNPSIQNMYYYLALKERPVHTLNENLAMYGFSATTTRRPNIALTLNNICKTLMHTTGKRYSEALPTPNNQEWNAIDNESGKLFRGTHNYPSLMLTLPSDAVENLVFLEKMIEADVTFFRINTAHDTLDDRKKMAENVKTIAKKLRKTVSIAVDLASWKMRTGSAMRELQPIMLADKKQSVTIVLTSDKDAFTCAATSSRAINHMATIAVSDAFMRKCSKGDIITLMDANGKEREVIIIENTRKQALGTLTGKTIIDEDSVLEITHKDKVTKAHPKNIRLQPQKISVSQGDLVYIGTDIKESNMGKNGKSVSIAFSDQGVLGALKVEDQIYIDDGKIGLCAIKIRKKGVTAKVIYSRDARTQIKEEKGINFPDTQIPLSALSSVDREMLPEIVKFADVINISFVQTKNDLEELKILLNNLGKSHLPIVAKVETKMSVQNLPEIICSLITHGQGGVMLARGDLAVEGGFSSLPRLQQDILQLCDAAHMPVIYATGVMESSMKNHLPSRAELIDLSVSKQASCLMLNKGPYVGETIKLIQEVYSTL